MRYTPMSVSEQCGIEREMLLHFRLAVEEQHNISFANGTTATSTVFKIRDHSGAATATALSQSFFSLAETPDAPVDCEEMILAIKYQMGYGWLAWFLFKNFAIPIIKWLWKRYHNPDPVGSPAT